MESPNIQSQKMSLEDHTLSGPLNPIDTQSIQGMKEFDKLVATSIKGASATTENTVDSNNNNSGFDYSKVLDIVKSLKSMSAEKQSQYESILTTRMNNNSENTLSDLMHKVSDKSDRADMDFEDEESDESLSESESGLNEYSMEAPNKKNLIDNVKENLDSLLQNDGGKKKFTEKRWWTPEEVTFLILDRFVSKDDRMNYLRRWYVNTEPKIGRKLRLS